MIVKRMVRTENRVSKNRKRRKDKRSGSFSLSQAKWLKQSLCGAFIKNF